MKKFFTTEGLKETQKIGEHLAQTIVKSGLQKKAVVICLQGDLGAGKTTFIQGFAQGLGVTEKVLSPTFIVMKRFEINKNGFKNFYHIDCYRLEGEKSMEALNLKDIISNPENIVAIEWAERIKKILPKEVVTIQFKYVTENERQLTIHNFELG